MRKQRLIKAALAVNFISASVAAGVLFTASPGSAESPYRASIDQCARSSMSDRKDYGECIKRADPALATPNRTVPAPAAAAPAVSAPVSAPTPAAAFSGRTGTVTSGADQVETAESVAAKAGNASAVAPAPPQSVVKIEPAAQPDSVASAIPVVLLETRLPLPPEPAPKPATPASPLASDSMMGALARLRQCESTNNYTSNRGKGYYGAYQFSLQTWRSLGLDGYPHEASPEVQDKAAIALQARDGWKPWPSCSRQLGLR